MYIKVLIIFVTALSAFSVSANQRLLASIKSISQSHEKDRVVSLLEENAKITDQVRDKLIKKHLKVFDGPKARPKSADFKAFNKDFAFFLNLDKLVTKEGEKTDLLPPQYVMSNFNKAQQERMQSFYDDFNTNIYPLLRSGIKQQKKSSIAKGLKLWRQNNTEYVQFMNSCINDLKKA